MDPCRYYRANLTVAAILSLMLYSSVAWAQQTRLIDAPIWALGVPLTVLVMAFAGSLVGFAHMPPVTPRKKLYTMIATNTLVASWSVVLLPEWRGWTVSAVAQPPLAGVLAVVSVVIVPLFMSKLPAGAGGLIDRFFARIFKTTPGGGTQ
jgi:hypothetical protein